MTCAPPSTSNLAPLVEEKTVAVYRFRGVSRTLLSGE